MKGGGAPMRFTWITTVSAGALLVLFLAQPSHTQQPAADKSGADWPMYRRDYAGTGYSPLAQITSANVARLAQVWTYRLQGDAPPPSTGRGGPGGPNSEASPIVVNGVMYLPAANRIVAL